MPSLFISYRRTDSPDTVKLIHERLKRRLPRWEIFYDHESIPLGEQFPERLRAKVASAAVVLVIIGPRWLEILQERKGTPIDHVRAEVRLALELARSVVPVLVGHAAMPTDAELADIAGLQPLLQRNGRPVRPDPDFDGDLEPIIAHLKQFDSDEAVGATLADKYTLTAEVGHGGMGVVYLAQQKQPVKRTVAVKLIKPGMDSRDVLARFDAERQALAVMDHPNIAKVHDAGLTASGRPFFVMEYVKGVHITQYCDEKKLTPQERLQLFIPVCNAVQHAHQKGIIHRDLKPSNVLVEVVDGRPVPKVIDFGLAKALGQKLTDQTLYTGLDTRIGTLEYSAPEQAAGRSFDVDTRSDIYSLGVMLYELLTGAPPFTREELLKIGEEKMRQVICEEAPAKPSKRLSSSGELPTIAARRQLEPSKLTRLVRGDLDWIVMKCLEKERDRRYKNANDIGEELQRFLANEPVLAGPPSAAYQLRKFVRRHRASLLTTTGVLLATVLGVAIAFWQITNALEGEKNANILAGQRLETVEQQKKDIQAQLSLAARVYCDRSEVEFQRGNIPDSLNWMVRAYETAKQANDPLERSYRDLLAGQSQGLKRMFDCGAYVEAVAFSPDGRTVLTGSFDNTARLWDAATGQLRGEPLRHEGFVYAVAFSPDGRTVLTCSWDKTARLWDAATGQPRGEPLPNKDTVNAVAFSPDSRTVLTGSDDKTARLWDAATGQLRGEPLRHEGFVYAVAFSPDGRTVLTGSLDKTARLWDTATGKLRGEPLRHEGEVRAVAFSPDGRTVLTGSDDKSARLWDAVTGKPQGEPLRHEGEVRAVTFNPDGRTALTGSLDGTARLWDAATGQPQGEPLRHEKAVSAVAFSPDGRTVLTGSAENPARLWDAATGKPQGELLRHEGGVNAVAFSPDGRTALTGSFDKTARLWDAATGQPQGEPLRHEGEVLAVAFSPDGRTALTGSTDKTARLWDAATGQPRGEPLRHEFAVGAVAFSPDGRTALTGSTDKTARLWDAAAGNPRGAPLRHESRVNAVAFSPDGRTVLTGSWDKTARLWDAATGQPRGEPLRHEREVYAVAFSPDGRTALTGSGHTDFTGGNDETARLWEVVEPAPDDLDRLRAWVHVRTGKAFDDQGVLRQLSQADWLQAWKDLEAHGGDWEAKPSGRRWHFIEADEATYAKQWFAAEFHLRRLLADPPNRAEPFPAAERVVELAEHFQKGNPDDAAPLEILGAALFRAGRHADAIARLNEAVEKQKQGGNVWTQLFLAMPHHQRGDTDKARDWLQKADAQMKKRQDDKDAPINGQERLRDQKLRQEASDLLNSSP
ncbi:MAG TPA: protein kinase [Gemmataceae bacterium]|nr:protein kinase [Gemmataceae bacterium]